MLEVAVIDKPAVAEASLDPVRQQILAALVNPSSAAALAPLVGLTRQKVNYHLRTLEEHGLVHLVENATRKHDRTSHAGKCRVVRHLPRRDVRAGSGSTEVPRPTLGAMARRGGRRGSSRGRRVDRRSNPAGKPLASYAIDSDITFATASDRADFARELGEAVNGLVAKYHDGNTANGRPHRLVVALHPSLKPSTHSPESEN